MKRTHDTSTAAPATAMARPLDAMWQAPAIIWTLLAGEGLAIVLAFAPGIEGDRWVYFGLSSLVVQWVALLALGGLYFLRHVLADMRPQRIAYVALGLLLLASWLVAALTWAVLGDLLSASHDTWQAFLLRLTGLALTVGLLGLAAFHNYWRARQAAVRAKQAELEALQARTHPHFLFNSLNTALALLHQRPDDAERVLLDLSDLFRSALAGPRFVPLSEELDLARRYLEIEQLRLGTRLDVEWDLPTPLPTLDVPALSIQPLVENAVRHGIEPRREGGRVEVVIVQAGSQVQITVRNDLPTGVAAAAAEGHGVGQPSVASRIGAMTGGRGSLATSVEGGRYSATITIPMDELPR